MLSGGIPYTSPHIPPSQCRPSQRHPGSDGLQSLGHHWASSVVKKEGLTILVRNFYIFTLEDMAQ